MQRAAVYPHPAQLELTRTRLEEKAKMTANLVLLVSKKLFCIKSYFVSVHFLFSEYVVADVFARLVSSFIRPERV